LVNYESNAKISIEIIGNKNAFWIARLAEQGEAGFTPTSSGFAMTIITINDYMQGTVPTSMGNYTTGTVPAYGVSPRPSLLLQLIVLGRGGDKE
jgi:hypothetical protein